METRKTYGVLLRNRHIHGEFTVIPSSENKISPSYVLGRHGLWPSLSNPGVRTLHHTFHFVCPSLTVRSDLQLTWEWKSVEGRKLSVIAMSTRPMATIWFQRSSCQRSRSRTQTEHAAIIYIVCIDRFPDKRTGVILRLQRSWCILSTIWALHHLVYKLIQLSVYVLFHVLFLWWNRFIWSCTAILTGCCLHSIFIDPGSTQLA